MLADVNEPEPMLSERLVRSRTAQWVAVILVAAIYAVSGRIGQLLGMGTVTAVWPPSGIAIAATLLLGRRVAPGVWLGSLVVNTWALLDMASPVNLARSVTTGTLIGVGATLQAVAGAHALRRFAGVSDPLHRVRHVVIFVVLSGMVCCLISSIIGTTSMALLLDSLPWHRFSTTWYTWWLGDTLGVLLYGPLILAWNNRRPINITLRRIIEGLIVLSMLGLVGLGTFVDRAPMAYMLLPILGWVAFRSSQRGLLTAVFIICAMAILATNKGRGFFVADSVGASHIHLTSFLSIVTVTALVLASVLDERGQAERALQQANDSLERKVDGRTAELRAANDRIQIELSERERAEQERLKLQERIIGIQAETLAELSIPLIPVSHQAIVVPLIGTVDGDRARRLLERVLDYVASNRMRVVIIDVTGVRGADAEFARALMTTERAVRLLGATTFITGISPEVARRLVELDVDLGTLVTFSTLQDGIARALAPTARG